MVPATKLFKKMKLSGFIPTKLDFLTFAWAHQQAARALAEQFHELQEDIRMAV